MGLVVNTNVAAINATRVLRRSTLALNKSLERLSSGLRINRAADDAAEFSSWIARQHQRVSFDRRDRRQCEQLDFGARYRHYDNRYGASRPGRHAEPARVHD